MVYQRQLLPYFDENQLCSGELLNNKYLVPCNVEHYLSYMYGTNWNTTMKENYFNHKTLKLYKKWSDIEWPNVLRYYNYKSGKFDREMTLRHLNNFSDVLITHIDET